MVRGPKKHLKRLNAPKSWMLDKLTGVFAPKPAPGGEDMDVVDEIRLKAFHSHGGVFIANEYRAIDRLYRSEEGCPHKSRECLPLCLILRNRLKYALNYKEVTTILQQRLVKVDGKIRMEKCYPCGIMDVVEIEKTDEHFRLMYDQKGRFVVHRITGIEAQYKLCKVIKKKLGDKGVPCVQLHDSRTIRYPDPMIKEGDSVMVDIASNKITDFVKFDAGALCMVTGGRNAGRVGIVNRREKHKGSFEVVHLTDAAGQNFATRFSNVFAIGTGNKPMVSLPKGKGIKLTILEEQRKQEDN
ncbi:unnamed protein product [Bathycoccus prasinos]